MPVIHAGVGGVSEAHHASPDGGTDPARGRSASIAMHEYLGAPPPIGPADPPELAHREPDEGGRFSHHQFAPLQGVEYHKSLLSTLRQRNHASSVRNWPGEDIFTETLGRTESLKHHMGVSWG